MELVLVERTFTEPVSFEEIQALEDAGSWCLDAYRVTFLKTLFAEDRRRMLCVYEAPDAEAVRSAERKAGVPFDLAWPCKYIDPYRDAPRPRNAPPGAQPVVVERALSEPMTAGAIERLVRDGNWCLAMHGVDYVESYLALDGARMVCLFRAPDAEAVRRFNDQVRSPWRATWPASVHLPTP